MTEVSVKFTIDFCSPGACCFWGIDLLTFGSMSSGWKQAKRQEWKNTDLFCFVLMKLSCTVKYTCWLPSLLHEVNANFRLLHIFWTQWVNTLNPALHSFSQIVQCRKMRALLLFATLFLKYLWTWHFMKYYSAKFLTLQCDELVTVNSYIQWTGT